MIDWLIANPLLESFYKNALQGAGMTVLTGGAGFLIGLILGTLLMLIRVNNQLFKTLVIVYVSAVRGTPLLIQLMIVYFVLPKLLGITLSPVVAGILALSFNTAAYISEILRGAYTSVPKGQKMAGAALGMRPFQLWLHVLLPQVFMRAIPPLTNELTILLKASSLLSVIAVSELATVARNATLETNMPLQIFLIAAASYFLILFCVSSISRLIESKVQRLLPNAR